MKKTLIGIVLATFLLSMPVASEARDRMPGDEIEAIATPGSNIAPAFLQSIGIGRRRTVRRRRMRRRMIRHRRVMRRRMVRRRVVRHRVVRRTRIRLGIPRRVGVGVRRRRY